MTPRAGLRSRAWRCCCGSSLAVAPDVPANGILAYEDLLSVTNSYLTTAKTCFYQKSNLEMLDNGDSASASKGVSILRRRFRQAIASRITDVTLERLNAGSKSRVAKLIYPEHL